MSTTRESESRGIAKAPTAHRLRLGIVLQAMRPVQWLKNILLFVPLLLAHDLADGDRWLATLIAFIAFCACASGSYLINDLFDLEADRTHPEKQHRPLASGALSPRAGVTIAAVLVPGGIAIAGLGVSERVGWMLAGYTLLTALYSMILKRMLNVDVLMLAGLFTLRVLTGGQASNVPVSPWLLVFSMFFFLSLATLKRFAELRASPAPDAARVSRRSYRPEDAELVQTTGISSGYLSILVIGLYITSDDVVALYSNTSVLWLICPLMLYWLTRMWFLARRGQMSEDPVLFAMRDKTSYLVGALVLGVGVWAALGVPSGTG